MKQAEALEILMAGHSAFVTGEPGAGKTYLTNEFIKHAHNSVAITATTGIAATHIGGRTIHSWAGLGRMEWVSQQELQRIFKSKAAGRILRARTLIIDEISMMSGDTLQMLDFICRQVRREHKDKPFGGIQVIFVGDFFQLPPVNFKRWQFAFDAPAWTELDPKICYLTEQHRQTELDFTWLLTAIRYGLVSAEEPLLRTRQQPAPSGTPTLYTHNRDVDWMNAAKLAELPGESKAFTMTSEGPPQLVDPLIKNCQSPEILELKQGASVIFTQNDRGGAYVNGTLGTVTDFDRQGLPIVELRKGGKKIAADWSTWEVLARGDEKPIKLTEPGKWEAEDESIIDLRARSAAYIRQIPLRLAWAITIHKSQGMTLDAAAMDLSAAFEYGQGYVALSRVRSLDGLFLMGWNQRALEVHPRVVEQNSKFIALSR